jgi:hypothetical protein
VPPRGRSHRDAPFADRIVHHAITAVLEPVWEGRFLPWSFANRRGLGTHAAMRHVAAGVERFRFSLQLDVRRYFPSIDHAILKGLVARHVREEPLLTLVRLVIDSGAGLLTREWKPVLFPGDDLLALARPKGMPIGNQSSQFLANVMLHPVDLCVAHEIKPGLAARYVDDIVLLDDDLGKLRAAREVITEGLGALRLVPHPDKTRLRSTNDGLTFVGYRLTKAGRRAPTQIGHPVPPSTPVAGRVLRGRRDRTGRRADGPRRDAGTQSAGPRSRRGGAGARHTSVREASMNRESPIFSRAYDLARETCKLTESFPRSRRAVLGRRLEEAAFDLHAALAGAASIGAPGEHLREADAALTRYRFCLRLACDLQLLSAGRTEEVGRIVSEIGRLLGGWQRKLASAR